MEKQVFEKSGLIPRSIIRTFDRFRKQLLPGSEKNVIQEFRISRYQVLVSVKSLIILFVIPLLLNIILKTFFLTPITQFYWNQYQTEIFLNSSQQERALKEIQKFEEKLFFEELLDEEKHEGSRKQSQSISMTGGEIGNDQVVRSTFLFHKTPSIQTINSSLAVIDTPSLDIASLEESVFFEESLKTKFQQKTIELALLYNQESIIAVTNIFGEFITAITILILFIVMKPQIIILKSFLLESLYSLSDTTKSFLLLFFTDLLVGFHSPRGWDIVLEFVLRHFGLPENQNFILLFVATFPVFLDTVFKYWIFRYLNKISPSTVVTYHNMIE